MAKKRGSSGSGYMGLVVIFAIGFAVLHGGCGSSSSSSDSSAIDSTASSTTQSTVSATTSTSPTTPASTQTPALAPQPAPAQQPASAQATPAPEPAPAPEPKAQVKIVSIVSPVPRNGTETVVAQVPPGTTASIEVDYASGPSHAAGLEDKVADSSGRVSWSWHVGGKTTLGSWPVTVTDSGASDQASFEVVH